MQSKSHYLEKELYELVQKDSSIFEFIQKGSLDGIWYWDIENPEHEWMSSGFWTTLGYNPAERKHLAAEWQDLIHPEDLKVALENFNKHCADPNHPYDQVVRYRHSDGSTVWIRCRGIAVRDKNGKPIRMLGAHTDLTLQKQAEETIRESEEKFRSIVTNIPDVIWTADATGKTTYISPNIEKVCGHTPDEVYEGGSSHWFTRIHPNDLENVQKAYKNLFEQGSMFAVEYQLKKKNGDWIWVNERSIAAYEKNGVKYADGILSNITERKLAEQEKERLINELQEALTKIKTLHGLLPICSSCNKIRDDKGNWSQMEQYISERSDADFTHGICPTCAKKLYPEYYHEDN